MLVFKKGVGKIFIVTLNESKTIAEPTYVFNFRHITLKITLTKEYSFNEDVSDYPSRCNEFIMPEDFFDEAREGQYTYEVIEKETDTILEVGKMLLQPATLTNKNGYSKQAQRAGFRN